MIRDLLLKIKQMKGFEGFIITNIKGKIHGADISKLNLSKDKIVNFIKDLNELFVRIHTTTKSLELGNVNYMILEMEKSKLLAICSKDKKVHIHFYIIFSHNGNINLAKNLILQQIPNIVESLKK